MHSPVVCFIAGGVSPIIILERIFLVLGPLLGAVVTVSMAASSSLQHRHGMVYLEDSSSGEFSAAEADGHLHHSCSHHPRPQPRMRSQNSYPAVAAARPSFQQVNNATTAASSRSSSGDDESYDEIYSSDEGSYFSEGDELADYWDPYCKCM